MTRPVRTILVFWIALFASAAGASYHTYQIDEIFSNADGTVQYVVLHEALGMDGQNLQMGRLLTSTGASGTTNYAFTKNLPGGSCSTYYGCTASPTAHTRVLIATQGFVDLGLITPDFVIPNGFLPLGGGTLNYAGVDQWTFGPLPVDGVNAMYRSGSTQTNQATNFSGNSMSLALAGPPAVNYQGLWWNPAESGWGVNFVHQGDQVFATWYTYDTSGNAYWLSMLAGRTTPAGNVYQGDIYVDVGPPFNNFIGSGTATKVGDGMLTFTDANNGSFFYELTAGGATGVSQTKAITRFSLGGAQPTCTYASAPNLAGATNYQDLWWVGPAENGWGVNFAHQGNQLFATWYTYDAKVAGNNAPLWLSALMTRQGATNVFTGPLTRTSGPRFDNFKASDVVQPVPTVGTATVTFTDGNHANFAYTTDGTGGLPVVTNQSKSITRFLFVAPAGTVCD